MDISFREYSRLVNIATAKTYKEYKEIINPDDLPIARVDKFANAHHIDHIVPKSMCYALGISVENCASFDNLQIIRGIDNLSKAQTLVNESRALLKKWLTEDDRTPQESAEDSDTQGTTSIPPSAAWPFVVRQR